MTVGDASNRWRGWPLLVAWIVGAISLAGPTWRYEPSPFADDPVPVMILLKTGESMTLSDVAPSRMERARLKVADLAAALRGKPLGLIAFAGSAHLVLPPTRDTSVVATMAAELSPDIMPEQGDDLAAVLRLARKTLGDAGCVIVVVDDTVSQDQLPNLATFSNANRLPICFLAIANPDTPELDGLRQGAAELSASVTGIMPDDSDIQTLVRRTAATSEYVAKAGDGARWAESGWWLIPLLAFVSLLSFRRTKTSPAEGGG